MPTPTEVNSAYELQRIDCNCNNCYFMQRDFDKFKESEELHYKWQWDAFQSAKDKLYARAKEWQESDDIDKFKVLLKEAESLKFQFDRSKVLINFGHCQKFDKPVSFIPNTCQIETQHCFIHRKDIALQ